MLTCRGVIMPLLIAGVFSCINTGYSQTSTINYNGNTLEMSSATNDTLYVADPVSQRKVMRVTKPAPLKLNSEKIYNASEVTSGPRYTGDEGHYHTFIFNKLQKELNKLNDGIYFFSINDVIINKDGKLVYYFFDGLHKAATFNNKAAASNVGFSNYAFVDNDIITDPDGEEKNPAELVSLISQRAKNLLDNAPQMQPAMLNGNAVNYRCKMFNADNTIQVKNHVATYSASDDAL